MFHCVTVIGRSPMDVLSLRQNRRTRSANLAISSGVTEIIYHGVFEPTVLYGVEVWAPALERVWAKKLLQRMQRNIHLRVCKSYRTVSGDALSVLANILPLA